MRKLFLILMAVVACAWSAVAQNRTISGTVVDAANNEPLIGATVLPNGGGQGTATDIDGNFTLSVPSNVKTATITYIGYTAKTVELKNGMTVHLAAESTTLDDVVVVAYGTATKESLTGSVAVVGAKEIEDRPVTSATAALEGNAPGVQVNSTTGQPGDDASIVIRGIGSVTSSTAPLIVVDGMQFHGAVSDINPQDIESMSVLKDAASCALYGNKGANGVILITTKRAKKRDKIDVNLTVRQGLYNRGLPEYDRLDVDQWMETTFAEYSNFLMYSNPAVYPDRATANAQGQEYFVANEVLNNIYNMPGTELFDADGKLVEGAHVLPGYTDLDWWDAISRTGYRQEYTLSAAAASEKYNVFASVGYLKENGYILRSDYERFTGRLNANFAPTTYLNFGVNLNATTQDSERNTMAGTSYAANPFSTQYYSPVYPYYQHDAEGNIMYDEVTGEPIYNTAGYLNNRNVALELRKNYTNYKYDMIDATVYGTAVIPYGFELKITGNLNRNRTTGTQYTNNIIGDAVSAGGRLTQAFDATNYYTFMQHLTWSHEYGRNLEHHVDVLLAHENYGYHNEGTTIQNIDQQLEDNYLIDNFPTNEGFAGSSVDDRSESYLARARYDYNQQYFAEASIRRDGSSRFHPNHRWGNFWSVGGSWIISKEKFMQQVDWISYLKLRAAYGAVGNNAGASAYAYMNLFGFSNYAKQLTFLRSQLAREDISWESTKTLDLAVEGSMFNDRLRFTIGYFDKRSEDLLFDVTLPASVGTLNGSNQSVLTNIGTMSNRGWEIGINGDLIRTKDFLWTAGIDATFIKNTVVKLPEANYKGTTMWLKEGHERYAWYLYEWAGVDELTGQSLYLINPESEDLYDLIDNQTIKTIEDAYNAMVESARADGVLVEHGGKAYSTSPTSKYATKNWAGTPLPTVYGSFNTALSWKGINLSVLFTYGLGGKTLDSNYLSLVNVSGAKSAVHVDALNSWTGVPEGMTADSPNRINPDILPQHNRSLATDSYSGTSDRWLVNSSYLVFKNLNLSYDLPRAWVTPLQMQRINLGVSVDNLFTVTARRGMNPQQSMSGGQSQTFGTARVFSFQLNVQF